MTPGSVQLWDIGKISGFPYLFVPAVGGSVGGSGPLVGGPFQGFPPGFGRLHLVGLSHDDLTRKITLKIPAACSLRQIRLEWRFPRGPVIKETLGACFLEYSL